MQKEKYEKYKYTNIKDLTSSIEEDIYNFCLRLQPFSKSRSLHYSSVISLLSKDKVLAALKSLLFLKDNHKHSYEYLDSLKKFSTYLTINKEKISQFNFDVIYERIAELKDPDSVARHSEEIKKNLANITSKQDDVIETLLTDVNGAVCNNEGVGLISNVLKMSHHEMRKIKSEVSDMC